MENCVALSSLLSVSSLSLPTSRCPGSLASVRGLLPLRALSLALSDRLSSLTLRHRAKLLSISSSDRADDALVRVICSRRAWALIPEGQRALVSGQWAVGNQCRGQRVGWH